MLAFFLTPPFPPTRKHLQLTLKHIRSFSWITLDKYYRLSPQNIDINNPPCCSPRLFIPNSKSSSFGPVSSCAIVLLSCCLWSGVQFVYQDITHNVSVLDLPNISDRDFLNSNSSNIILSLIYFQKVNIKLPRLQTMSRRQSNTIVIMIEIWMRLASDSFPVW